MKKETAKIIETFSRYAYFVTMIIVGITAYIYRHELVNFYSNPQQIYSAIGASPYLSPIIFILLQSVQVLVFFLPGSLLTIAGGALFGVILGTIYSIIGTMIGSTIVFLLARRFGSEIISRFINKKELHHFDIMVRKNGKMAVLVTRAVPVLFPNDIISYAAGLTSLKLSDYILFSTIGFGIHLSILSAFGKELFSANILKTLLISSVIVAAFLCYAYRHKLKLLLLKEIREFEEEVSKLEKESEKEIKIIEKDIEIDYEKIKEKIAGKKHAIPEK